MTIADAFRALHNGQTTLLLANAWDAGTARLVESIGASAVATTSAGVAWSRGFADGNAIDVDTVINVVSEITRVISVPLSVDAESGYSDDPEVVADFIERLVAAGAVGINLEDGSDDPTAVASKFVAIRRRASTGPDRLFINARTDVVLKGQASGDDVVPEVVRRARLYLDAGADSIFVPGLKEPRQIEQIAAAIAPSPLALMVVPGLPSPDELHGLGVSRLSAGSALTESALEYTRALSAAFLAGDTAAVTAAPAIAYGEINGLFQA